MTYQFLEDRLGGFALFTRDGVRVGVYGGCVLSAEITVPGGRIQLLQASILNALRGNVAPHSRLLAPETGEDDPPHTEWSF
jgi:hypothetical protein